LENISLLSKIIGSDEILVHIKISLQLKSAILTKNIEYLLFVEEFIQKIIISFVLNE
jgi:hypothetical protein